MGIKNKESKNCSLSEKVASEAIDVNELVEDVRHCHRFGSCVKVWFLKKSFNTFFFLNVKFQIQIGRLISESAEE